MRRATRAPAADLVPSPRWDQEARLAGSAWSLTFLAQNCIQLGQKFPPGVIGAPSPLLALCGERVDGGNDHGHVLGRHFRASRRDGQHGILVDDLQRRLEARPPRGPRGAKRPILS